jgi:hypothetical protein
MGCSSRSVAEDFADGTTWAETVIFDPWDRIHIPPMRAYFYPSGIYQELLDPSLQNVDPVKGAINIAEVFHEALHAYTRVPDFPQSKGAPSLKGMLGCSINTNPPGYTWDITLYLRQFTREYPGSIVTCPYAQGPVPDLPVNQTSP